MYGYPYKSKDIQMDIHKSMDNWRMIYINMDIHLWIFIFLRISIAECPCLDIHAWISMWISTLVCKLKTDIQKSSLSMLISVELWKSMHGFAMDSRTREKDIANDTNLTWQLWWLYRQEKSNCNWQATPQFFFSSYTLGGVCEIIWICLFTHLFVFLIIV